jgi:GTP-binding protein HflX
MSRPDNEEQKNDVVKILENLGMEYDGDGRIIEVLNKIDLLDEDEITGLRRKAGKDEGSLAISAVTGEGVEELLLKVENIVCRNRKVVDYVIDAADGRALSWLYSRAEILERKDSDQTICLRISIEPVNMRRFEKEFNYQPEIYGR